MGIDSTSDGAVSPIIVVAHPVERRRGRAAVPMQAGPCCCCCCCCCLHSLGGIIGASVGANLGGPEPRNYMRLLSYWDEEEELEARPPSLLAGEGEAITAAAPFPAHQPRHSGRPERWLDLRKPGPSAVSLFWWSFLVLVLVGFVIGLVSFSLPSDAPVVAAIIIVLTLPVFQLGAGVVAALILGLSSRFDKGYQLRKLGKILLGMVAGTMIGMLVMVGIVVLFAIGNQARLEDLLWIAIWGGFSAVFLVLSLAGLRALTRR